MMTSDPTQREDAARPDAVSAQIDPDAPIDLNVRRRSRMTLIGIVAAFFIPLILAIIWLRVVQSGGGGELGDTSRGQLIQPGIALADVSLTDLEGAALDPNQIRGIWTMLYVPEGECTEICQKNLYHMRQIRLALNNRMKRVQRMVVPLPSASLDQALLDEHPGLFVIGEAARSKLAAAIASAKQGGEGADDGIYLIDPLGNMMMRFPPDLEPGSILKDIKHLLKVSKIG